MVHGLGHVPLFSMHITPIVLVIDRCLRVSYSEVDYTDRMYQRVNQVDSPYLPTW